MWKFIFICVVIGSVTTDAATLKKRKRYASGGYAGGYAGAGSGSGSYSGSGGYGGYGGIGSYSGTGGFDDYGGGFGYAPDFGAGFIDPYVFHQQLTAQILAQHAAQNNALTSTYTSGDAFVTADASSYPDEADMQIQQQNFAHQQALYDSIRRQSNKGHKGQKNNRYAPNYASASGSIGPNGFHQSAHIHPENPSVPNINNRFSTSSSSSPNGFKGVSVSSYSSSSDNNGKRTSHRGAQTTVNDNGKVTTYKVES